jgi:uncharacterized membrane protein YgdD (TMEM256/DUF423 family)
MKKTIIVTAAILGALAVVAGAFGAHGLQNAVSAKDLDIWHTAVQYHFYHVFAMLFLSTLTKYSDKLVRDCYYLFLFGIVLFSGSLYLLTFHEVKGYEWTVTLGPITPIGGLLFIVGWVILAVAAIKKI